MVWRIWFLMAIGVSVAFPGRKKNTLWILGLLIKIGGTHDPCPPLDVSGALSGDKWILSPRRVACVLGYAWDFALYE